MKKISITESVVSIAIGKQKYNYPIVRGKLNVSLEEVNGMSDEVRIILLILAAAKTLPIGDHYQDIREPVWKFYNKTTGLSPQGLEQFGKADAVAEAVALLKQSLPKEEVQQPSFSSEIEEQKVGEIVSSQKARGGEEYSSVPTQEPPDLAAPSVPFQEGEPSVMNVQLVDTDFFKPNPLSTMLYGSQIGFGILDSVIEYGVLEPIRALVCGRIIDGSQRWGAAKEGNWKKIPAIFIDVPADQELELILRYNQQRIKTTKERLREFRAHLDIEKRKAAERSGIRTDLEQQLPEGHSDWGKARDLAGKKVGLSGSSAERGLRVLEEIEKRGSNDITASVDLKLIENGINAAWTYASSLGWFDSAVKPKCKSNRKAKNTIKQQDNVGDQDSTQLSDIDSSAIENGLDEESITVTQDPVKGWLTDEFIADITRELGDEGEDLRKSISYMRPRLYILSGTIPDKSKASRLRLLAEAITTIATKYEEIAK